MPSPAKAFPPMVAPAVNEGKPGATAQKDGVGRGEPLGAGSEPHALRAALGEAGDSLGPQADPDGAALNRDEPVSAPSASAVRRHSWAELLQRVFEVDALRCPSCGERMRILAAITDPAVARRILKCLGLPPRAPPLTPPAPPESVTGSWFSEPEAYDFDQSPPGEWGQGG